MPDNSLKMKRGWITLADMRRNALRLLRPCTNKNIDDVITKLRDDRSGYQKSHRNEIDQLRRWADVFVKENGIERHELVVSQR